MNNRLVFIVEGDSEVAFVNNKVIPYLYGLGTFNGWSINAQKITTSRKHNTKGGVISVEYLKNEIQRTISQTPGIWITTLLDFFRLPVDFPHYTTDGSRISEIEEGLKDLISYDRFIPYIQKYEFETLLFADISGFEYLDLTENQMKQICEIAESHPDIETINGGPDTAPSKRLAAIFNYQKVLYSEIVLSDTTIEQIRDKSHGFDSWMKKIEEIE